MLTCILHVYLLVASPPSFFSVLYLSAHSISPLLLSTPLSVLLPWFNNLPTGRSTSYRHAPSSLALALASAPPSPLVHARATATTATRGCASSAGGYSWSYSSSAKRMDGGCGLDLEEAIATTISSHSAYCPSLDHTHLQPIQRSEGW